MCFYSKLSKKAVELENRFNARMEQPELFVPYDIVNGFSFPLSPVICDHDPGVIRMFRWGLIPSWSKDKSIQKNTLNARIETIHEKPAFRSVCHQRCLVIADGFYEWKWLDEAGKKKQKYLLSLPGDELFSFAGIYSEWTDMESGESINTYSIVTTEAAGIMEEIHNSKHRMPVILNETNEKKWLRGASSEEFTGLLTPLVATAV